MQIDACLRRMYQCVTRNTSRRGSRQCRAQSLSYPWSAGWTSQTGPYNLKNAILLQWSSTQDVPPASSREGPGTGKQRNGECRNLAFDIQVRSTLIVRGVEPSISGQVLGYTRATSSLLYPYVFVAGPNKHAHFRPSSQPSGNFNSWRKL